MIDMQSIKAAALAAKEVWPGDFADETLSPIERHINTSNPSAVLKMCTEIEQLHSLATTAMEQHEMVGRLYQESVKEIERLHEEIRTEQRLSCREQVGIQQVEIERLTAEVNEQARLLGGGAELELRARAVMQQALEVLIEVSGDLRISSDVWDAIGALKGALK